MSDDEKATGDLIWGADPIAAFVTEISDTPINRRRIYYCVEKQYVPIGRIGDQLCRLEAEAQSSFRRDHECRRVEPLMAPS
jgi:hypothetical protein